MKDINLIPKDYLIRKNKPRIIAWSAVFTLLAISLLVYLYIVPLNNIKALEQEIKKYDEVILEYNILKNKIDKMLENEELIQKKLEVLNKISINEIKPTKVFEMVNSSLPKDVWLTDLNYTFTNVSLTAVAGSTSGVTEFYIELSKKNEFTNVKLSPVSIDENGYNFTIQFSLSTGSDGNNEKRAE